MSASRPSTALLYQAREGIKKMEKESARGESLNNKKQKTISFVEGTVFRESTAEPKKSGKLKLSPNQVHDKLWLAIDDHEEWEVLFLDVYLRTFLSL
jgi:hypothetical protein